jgi:hypothetical protein
LSRRISTALGSGNSPRPLGHAAIASSRNGSMMVRELRIVGGGTEPSVTCRAAAPLPRPGTDPAMRRRWRVALPMRRTAHRPRPRRTGSVASCGGRKMNRTGRRKSHFFSAWSRWRAVTGKSARRPIRSAHWTAPIASTRERLISYPTPGELSEKPSIPTRTFDAGACARDQRDSVSIHTIQLTIQLCCGPGVPVLTVWRPMGIRPGVRCGNRRTGGKECVASRKRRQWWWPRLLPSKWWSAPSKSEPDSQ